MFLIFLFFSSLSNEANEDPKIKNTPTEEANKLNINEKINENQNSQNLNSEIPEKNKEKSPKSLNNTSSDNLTNINNENNAKNEEDSSKQNNPQKTKRVRNKEEYEARSKMEQERKEVIQKNQDYWRQNGKKDSFLRGEKKEPKAQEIICVGAHSRPLWGKNKCVCEEGYFASDDEINTTGCYTCEPKCHAQSYCAAPNVCKCKFGLIEDNVNCTFPQPVIKKVHSPAPNQLSPVPVIVEYNAPNFIPYNVFCRFGDKKIEPALIFNNGSVACLSPDKMRGETKIQISFDGVTYSKAESYTIVPGVIEPARKAIHLGVQPEGLSWKIPTVIIILIILCIIAFVILHYFNDKKAEETSREELQPLVPNKITPETRIKKREQLE